MLNEINELGKGEKVKTDLHGRFDTELFNTDRAKAQNHFILRLCFYAMSTGFLIILCILSVYEVYWGRSADQLLIIPISGAVMFCFYQMYRMDDKFVKYVRSVINGTSNKEVPSKLRSEALFLREQLRVIVEDIPFSDEDGFNGIDLTRELDGLHSVEEIKLLQAQEELLEVIESIAHVYRSYLKVCGEQISSLKASKADLEDTLRQQSDRLANLNSQIDQETDSRDSLEGKYQQQSEKLKEVSKEKRELQDKLDQAEEKNLKTQKILSQEQERLRAMRGRYDNEKALREAIATEGMTAVSFLDFARHFTNVVEQGDFSNSDEKSEEAAQVSLLYAAMHEHFPDMKRVKELALIPHEILRARQIQAVIQHYTDLIVEVENNENLPTDEKKHVIRAYRMARERDLADAGAEV